MTAPITDANGAQLYLFGCELRARVAEEFAHDSTHLTTPSLNTMALAAQQIGQKLSQEARNALYFSPNADPELRVAKVSLALQYREMIENAEPDMVYLKGGAIPDRRAFGNEDRDEWVPQPEPNP